MISLRTKLEIAAMLAFCVAIWHFATPKREPVGKITTATPAPELKGQDKQDIAPSKVAVYVPGAKKNLPIPEEVKDDPNKYILASSKLPNDTHTHTVTTVIDKQTGQAQTYDEQDPYPWFAAEQRGSWWAGYGIKNGGIGVWRLSVKEYAFQIKAVHFGGMASIDSDGAAYAGIGAGGEW